jgi:hypothetical protein
MSIVIFFFIGLIGGLLFLILGYIFIVMKEKKRDQENTIQAMQNILLEFNRSADSWVEILEEKIKEGEDLEKRLSKVINEGNFKLKKEEEKEESPKCGEEKRNFKNLKKNRFWQRGKKRYHKVYLLAKSNTPNFNIAKSLRLTKGEIDFISRLTKRLRG